MRYFVLAPTGERYGPADVPTLSLWAADGRITPTSKLMEEMSGSIVAASSVPGLVFPQASPAPPAPAYGPMQPPPPSVYQAQSNYPRPGSAFLPAAAADNGSKDLLMSFGMALGAPLLGCITIYGVFLAAGGIAAAWRAIQKGQKLGILALILNIVAVGAAFYMRFILRYQLLSGTRY
ncbi:MAG: hypothetical protein ACHQ50_05710 [Fimbriimonadales bacterium]